MDIKFIVVQLIGLVAWIFLFLSYYRKNTNKILVFHMIASFILCIHYGLLGAYSGLFICACEAVFDFCYYKTDKDKYIYIASIPIRIIGGLFSYKNLVDLLPIISSLIDGYTLTKKKNIVLYGAICSYSLWVVYNIYVGSYSGIVTDGLVVISNILILFFNINIFDKKDKSRDAIKR